MWREGWCPIISKHGLEVCDAARLEQRERTVFACTCWLSRRGWGNLKAYHQKRNTQHYFSTHQRFGYKALRASQSSVHNKFSMFRLTRAGSTVSSLHTRISSTVLSMFMNSLDPHLLTSRHWCEIPGFFPCIRSTKIHANKLVQRVRCCGLKLWKDNIARII